MAYISISCPSCSATEGVVRNGKSTAGHQRYLCSHCRKTWQLQFTYTLSARYTPENYLYGHEWRRMSRQCTHYGRWPQHDFTTLKKLRPQSVNSRIQPGSDVIVCAEMDEQWGYVGAKSRQRWLFYAYDRIRRTVVAHVFGERTLSTLERLLGLLSAFEVVVWMTDGWPLYESRLKGELHVISKRYTQRIERHNLNLRQHLARLGRKSLSFSKSVELHDKVIGHYLNIKHYQ